MGGRRKSRGEMSWGGTGCPSLFHQLLITSGFQEGTQAILWVCLREKGEHFTKGLGQLWEERGLCGLWITCEGH